MEAEGPPPVEKAAELLLQGKGREALDTFQALIEEDPTDGERHAHYAVALVHLGFAEAAREIAREAVHLDTNEVTLRAKGWILEHDLVGRRHAPGWDQEGAMATYGKLVALDRTEGESWGRLIDAMVVAPHGGFEVSEYLDRAVGTCIEGWAEAADVQPLIGGCVEAVAATGRWEVATVLSDRKDAAELPVLNYAHELVTSPDDVAEAFLTMAESEPHVAMALIQTTLSLLVTHRAYPPLLALTEGLSRVTGESPPQLDTLAELKRFEERTFDESDPSQVPARLLQAVFMKAPPVEPRALLSSHALGVDEGEGTLESFEEVWDVILDMVDVEFRALNEDVPKAASLDSVLAFSRFEAEGDSEQGWQVRMEMYDGSTVPISFFVIQEDDEPKLLLAPFTTLPFASIALSKLDADRPDLALLWLLRARHFVEEEAGEEPPAGAMRFAELVDEVRGTEEFSASHVKKLRLAAAMLGTIEGGSPEVRAVLEEALEAAEDPDEQRELELRLLSVLEEIGDVGEYLEMAESFHASHPDEEIGRRHLMVALEKAEEHERILGLTDGADEEVMLLFRANALRRLGRLAEAEQAFAAMDSLMARSNALWFSLFLEEPTVEQEEEARALLEHEDLFPAAAHTSVAALAEVGEIDEATDAFRFYTEVFVDGDLQEKHWYLVGRLAERHGLPDVADSAYQRLEAPEQPSPDSSYELARRRLDALDQ